MNSYLFFICYSWVIFLFIFYFLSSIEIKVGNLEKRRNEDIKKTI